MAETEVRVMRFEDGRRPRVQECRWLLDAKKHKEMDSSLELLGGTSRADTLTLAQ